MPCYDPPLKSELDHEKRALQRELPFVRQEVAHYKGVLCALLTELEKEGNAERLIINASRNGLVDIYSFWVKHQESDEARVMKKFHQFSVHEQSLIKQFLVNT